MGSPELHSSRRLSARSILVRSFALAVALTILPFLYVVYDSKLYSNQGGKIFQNLTVSGVYPRSNFGSYDEYVRLQLKKTMNSKLRKLWTTRDWRRKVDKFAAVFQDLSKKNLLKSGGKALCIGARVGQEVMALKENGIQDAIGIDLVSAPPLVIKGDMHRHPFADETFDFEFSNVLDHALFPALFVSEIERTLKPGGVACLHVALNARTDKYSVNDLVSLDGLLALFKNSELVHVRQVDAFGLNTEIVMKKKISSKDAVSLAKAFGKDEQSYSNCSVPKEKLALIEKAEPLIIEEPKKPWLTLKRNVQNLIYIPTLIDIKEKHDRYIYIDVGARNYGSSIAGWFKKQYPKQDQKFHTYAIEADRSYEEGYKGKKGVTLLPYAAWIRNETLVFGTSKETEKPAGEGGMGRIIENGAEQGTDDPSFLKVQGFDMSEWMMNNLKKTDFVVMKMDIEGTEFQLLPKLFESGAICLIDELFLECHYNRWQKSFPGRTKKFSRTYGECVDLFQSLRRNGVLVHQWW